MSERKNGWEPSQNHWAMLPGTFRERITRKQLQHVLLKMSDPIVQGMACNWKHKHLGVGIYELWVESRP